MKKFEVRMISTEPIDTDNEYDPNRWYPANIYLAKNKVCVFIPKNGMRSSLEGELFMFEEMTELYETFDIRYKGRPKSKLEMTTSKIKITYNKEDH